LALFTTVLFSIPCALQVGRADFGGALKEGARGGTDAYYRLRAALVVSQIALGLVLLSGAGVLAAGFVQLMGRNLGFRPDHLLSFNITLPDAQYSEEQQVRFHARLVERLSVVPGVVSSAGGTPLPLAGERMTISFNIPERPSAPSERPG